MRYDRGYGRDFGWHGGQGFGREAGPRTSGRGYDAGVSGGFGPYTARRPWDEERYDADFMRGYGHRYGGLTENPRDNMVPDPGETDFLGRRYHAADRDTAPRGLYDQEYRQATPYDRGFAGARGYGRDFRGDEAGYGIGRRYGAPRRYDGEFGGGGAWAMGRRLPGESTWNRGPRRY